MLIGYRRENHTQLRVRMHRLVAWIVDREENFAAISGSGYLGYSVVPRLAHVHASYLLSRRNRHANASRRGRSGGDGLPGEHVDVFEFHNPGYGMLFLIHSTHRHDPAVDVVLALSELVGGYGHVELRGDGDGGPVDPDRAERHPARPVGDAVRDERRDVRRPHEAHHPVALGAGYLDLEELVAVGIPVQGDRRAARF